MIVSRHCPLQHSPAVYSAHWLHSQLYFVVTVDILGFLTQSLLWCQGTFQQLLEEGRAGVPSGRKWQASATLTCQTRV